MDGFESCTTPGCNGLPNYAAPGKGHIDGCTYPLAAPLSDGGKQDACLPDGDLASKPPTQGPGLTEDERTVIDRACWQGVALPQLFTAVESIIARRVRAASRTALIEWADELDKPPYDLWARAAIPQLRARAATYDTGDDE